MIHSFISRKGEASVCVACDAVITVKHILIGCADLVDTREKYFEERSLYSLFRKVIPEIIFDFLREIGVFLQNIKYVEVMFVWSVLKESCFKVLCEMFYHLFN